MNWILSIDFGTSSTTACIAEGGRVEVIEIDGRRATPSGVWVADDGSVVVGTAAERQARLAPDRWERCPKRALGEPVPLLLGEKELPVDVAVSAVLSHVGQEAARRQGETRPDLVRLTCPARWGRRRRGALLTAAVRAGFGPPAVNKAPELIDEPVAAAVHFAARGNFQPTDKVAVYDLGGGTFDAAVLAASTAGGFDVIAVGGIDGLGGENFDSVLYSHVIDQLTGSVPEAVALLRDTPDTRWRRTAEDLLRDVRRAKEELSTNSTAYVDTGPLVDVPVKISRRQFERLIRPQIDLTADCLLDVINRAGTTSDRMAGVFLAGGSSRIPMVAEILASALGVQPRILDEPKSVVAAGAARWRPHPVETAQPTEAPPPSSPPMLRQEEDRPSVKPAEELPTVAPSATRPTVRVPGPPDDSEGDDQTTKSAATARGRRKRLVVLGIAGALLLLGGAAAIAGVFLARGGPTGPPPPLSPRERQLASRIPSGAIAGTCAPLRDREDGNIPAAITCAPANDGASRLDALQYKTADEVRSGTEDRIRQLNLSQGSCVDGGSGQQTWPSGGNVGTVLCYVDDTGAHLMWTYDNDWISLHASRSDGDLAGLESWWERQLPWSLN